MAKGIYEDPYTDYAEVGYPKENIFKKASKYIGNLREPKYVFGKGKSERFEEEEEPDKDLFDPFGGKSIREKGELRKKKSKSPKTKRKQKSKKCGCK